MKKDYLSKSLSILLLVGIGAVSLYAWTGPTALPPDNGNIASPINTSSTAQTKLGNFFSTGLISGTTGLFNSIRLVTGAGAGKVLTSDASGNAGWVATSTLFSSISSSNNIMYGLGNNVTSTSCYHSGGIGSGGSYGCVYTFNSNSGVTWGVGTYNTVSAMDTCDGDFWNQYTPKSTDSKVCVDVYSPWQSVFIDDAASHAGNFSYQNIAINTSVPVGMTKVFSFTGDIDSILDISLNGNTYTESNESAHGDLPNEHNFYNGGLKSDVPVILNILTKSSGSITIIQQPSSSNGYTTKIELSDPAYGESRYSFELYQ